MTGELNDDSRDLLYVGRNEEVIERVKRRLPRAILRQIDSHEDLSKYLIEKSEIFNVIITSGVGKSRYHVESAIFPRLILCEPEFPEFKDGSGGTAEGVYFIQAIRERLVKPNGYLLLTDNFYGSSREKIIEDCKKRDVPLIEQGELESRLLEFIDPSDNQQMKGGEE